MISRKEIRAVVEYSRAAAYYYYYYACFRPVHGLYQGMDDSEHRLPAPGWGMGGWGEAGLCQRHHPGQPAMRRSPYPSGRGPHRIRLRRSGAHLWMLSRLDGSTARVARPATCLGFLSQISRRPTRRLRMATECYGEENILFVYSKIMNFDVKIGVKLVNIL